MANLLHHGFKKFNKIATRVLPTPYVMPFQSNKEPFQSPAVGIFLAFSLPYRSLSRISSNILNSRYSRYLSRSRRRVSSDSRLRLSRLIPVISWTCHNGNLGKKGPEFCMGIGSHLKGLLKHARSVEKLTNPMMIPKRATQTPTSAMTSSFDSPPRNVSVSSERRSWIDLELRVIDTAILSAVQAKRNRTGVREVCMRRSMMYHVTCAMVVWTEKSESVYLETDAKSRGERVIIRNRGSINERGCVGAVQARDRIGVSEQEPKCAYLFSTRV